LFTLVALAFLILSLVAVAPKGEFNFVVADARGYYIYLPSLIIDRDLDFRNEMTAHWGPGFSPALLEDTTPRGLVRNRYPVGFALTLLPGFLIAHGVSSAAFALTRSQVFRPDGYSPLYQLAALTTALAAGLATMLLLHRWLTAFVGVSQRRATTAILAFWVGSPYAYYYFREPLMVHVVSTFWVTVALWLATGPNARASKAWAGPALLASLGFAVVTRPTNVFLVTVMVWWLWERRSERRTSIWYYLPAAVPAMAQVFVWKALFGTWLAYSYGNERFLWGTPALWQTLWSPRHGLFLWSPLLLLAFVGLVTGSRALDGAGRRLAVALLIGFVMLWYFNSAWQTWWFGDAFGGRAFLELAPLYVLGLALGLARMDGAARTVRRLGHGLLGLSIAYSYALMFLYITHRISRSEALF
jgi:hypothetical protein